MKKRITVYWLIPSKPESDLFRDVIRILAQQFDAPRFQSHLTLCQTGNRASAGKSFQKIQAKPVRLRIRGIAHSNKFTKTLFVRFTPNQSLRRLVTELGGKSRSLRDPHVSLLYKQLPASIRRELAAAIKLPFREVTFDALEAVSCEIPCQTRRDVERWQVVVTKRLPDDAPTEPD